MFGLTPLGTVHTLIALVALVAGLAALATHREISADRWLGKVYICGTALTCLTGFGIFQHGGFGKPHALGVLTLLVLGAASLPGALMRFGPRWRIVSAALYTLTVFFHFVPGITETFTRVPAGSPLFDGPEDPALEKVIGTLFLVFAAGILLQVRHLRRMNRMGGPGAARLA
jgi:uncharacterized membrane protein